LEVVVRRNLTLVLAFAVGVLTGTLFFSRASAQPVPGPGAGPRQFYEYKVVGASGRLAGYQSDLDEYAGKGWRFAGSFVTAGAGSPSHLIFERPR
jgi:hypothetical protein